MPRFNLSLSFRFLVRALSSFNSVSNYSTSLSRAFDRVSLPIFLFFSLNTPVASRGVPENRDRVAIAYQFSRRCASTSLVR